MQPQPRPQPTKPVLHPVALDVMPCLFLRVLPAPVASCAPAWPPCSEATIPTAAVEEATAAISELEHAVFLSEETGERGGCSCLGLGLTRNPG